MIKPFMSRACLTQAELAQKTGIAQSTISLYVRQKKDILPKHARLLNKVLHIPLYVMCPTVWPEPKRGAK